MVSPCYTSRFPIELVSDASYQLGMGNRFSTVTQYHSLVTGHGVLAAITFLFIVPIAIFYARFHRDHIRGRRIHSYLQVITVGLSTVVFILGFFAVGPSRNLTNPHHGIGVAIYVLVLVQAMGGAMVRNITKKSLRLFIHRWLGSATAILAIVQVPLGLTLYGSPKFTFILYALWMGFLFLVYFVLSFRHEPNWDDNATMYGGRSAYEGRSTYGGRSNVGRSESGVGQSERTSRRGSGWFGPLVAGVGIGALLRGRRRDADQGRSRGESPSQSGRTPEVLPSRRGSPSYFVEDEKSSDRTDRRDGGFMNKLLAAGGVLGAGALAKKLMNRRDNRAYDEEYSAVATDTPSRFGPHRARAPRKNPDDYTESDFTEDRTELAPRPRTPLLPGPGNPAATAAALSAAEPRPLTPRASHGRPGQSTLFSNDVSDYTSYVSPSRRTPVEEPRSGAGKGLLAGLGLGWLVKKLKERRDRRAEEERLREAEERREELRESRYTGDPYSTPTRPPRQRPPQRALAPTATIMTEDTESSMLEAFPPRTAHVGPPMPPLDTAQGVPGPAHTVGSRSRSRSRSRAEPEHVAMPPMPEDPRGLLHTLNPESGSESYMSPGGHPHRRHSSRQRREEERAAAAAAGGTSQQGSSRQRDRSQARSQSVSVKVKYHDDRNVTLRRLTEDEARREQRRGRSDSVSSLSESETPGGRRYRRDGSARRRAESDAERLVSDPLSPPTPAFAGGRRGAKDSAYYSGQPGQPGPSSNPPSNPPLAAPTVSSVESPDSHGTWSALSPSPPGPAINQRPGSIAASAAERRRRRKLNRQPPGGAVDYN